MAHTSIQLAQYAQGLLADLEATHPDSLKLNRLHRVLNLMAIRNANGESLTSEDLTMLGLDTTVAPADDGPAPGHDKPPA